MNTDELKYFIEAAKEQNLSKAARTLGTSQSTLSHAIRRLEVEFDCKLFSKSGKSLKLTAQGRRFSESANQLIKNIRELKQEISSGATPISGHLKAAGTLGAPAQILTHAILRLPASLNSSVEITSLRSAEILKKVASKELDFGLCYDPQPYPHVKIRTVAASESVVVVRKGHPLLKLNKNRKLAALFSYSWAHPRHLPGVATCTSHPVFSNLQRQPKVRYFYDSYDVATQILLGSDAWALLPKAILSKHPGLTATLEAYEEPIHLVLVSHEEGNEQVVEQLKESLRIAAQLQGWRLKSNFSS